VTEASTGLSLACKRRDGAHFGFLAPKRKCLAFCSRAFEHRNCSTLTLGEPDSGAECQQLPRVPEAVIVVAGEEQDTQPSPSELLSDADWVRRVRHSFKSVGNTEALVTESMKAQANDLHSLLKKRLPNHIKSRVHKDKQSHYSLKFTNNNLSRFAAIAVLADHVKDDLKCAGDDTCLLRPPPNNFKSMHEVESLQGCYLYWDSSNYFWVRSGKVAGEDRSFRARHDEHIVSSLLENEESVESLFYTSYPHKGSSNISDVSRRAYFQDLVLYCGIGFTSETADVLCEAAAEEGVLFWDDTVLEQISNSSGLGGRTTTLEEKQLHMVAFLCEIGYDLLLSPSHNVSCSPGYESCGLVKFLRMKK